MLARSSRLVFLGWPPFHCENPAFLPLDFLGFPRPKRAFSMGYEGFSLKISSPRFSPSEPRVGGPGVEAMGKRQDCSWGELNLVSDFLQLIVGSYSVSYGCRVECR